MAEGDENLTIELDRTVAGGEGGYVPGEALTGVVRWSLGREPVKVTVRLFWRTEGKGSSDSGLAGELTFEDLAEAGEQAFVFDGPDGPYSYSGTLVSVVWAIEAIARPGKHVARADLVLSPTGREVRA